MRKFAPKDIVTLSGLDEVWFVDRFVTGLHDFNSVDLGDERTCTFIVIDGGTRRKRNGNDPDVFLPVVFMDGRVGTVWLQAWEMQEI